MFGMCIDVPLPHIVPLCDQQASFDGPRKARVPKSSPATALRMNSRTAPVAVAVPSPT